MAYGTRFKVSSSRFYGELDEFYELGGSRSITSELLEFFADGGAWRLFYYRKILKELKNTETFLWNGEL